MTYTYADVAYRWTSIGDGAHDDIHKQVALKGEEAVDNDAHVGLLAGLRLAL
jgi:hypothetical protein